MNHSEAARLVELKRLKLLDASADKAYDDLTKIAARICGTSAALVSLVDTDQKRFKSTDGTETTEAEETPLEFTFCAHAIKTPDQVMVVSDTTKDERFRNDPLVVGDLGIRFYAGAPLVTRSGRAVGTLCVLDWLPHQLDEAQLDLLQFLAKQVVAELELHANGVA
ncbi:MAG: hypothetical protein JWQ73_3898 [Variovorax sp.]|nr:hypothetical protein [Variovorax sp.]